MYLRSLTLVNGITTLGCLWLCVNNGASFAESNVGAIVHPLKLTIESQSGESPNKSSTDESVKVENAMAKKEPQLQCYVCSWSIMGLSNVSENVDICSTGHFMVEGASVTPCDDGCQTVSFKNSEKEEITHFYRNCWKQDSGKELVDKCYKLKTVYGLEQRCECVSNLCNASPSIHLKIWNNIQLSVFIPLIMTLNFNLFE